MPQLRPGQLNARLLFLMAFSIICCFVRPFALGGSRRCPQACRRSTLSVSLHCSPWPRSHHRQHTRSHSVIPSTNNPADGDDSRKHRIVFLGTPDVAATTLQTLFDASTQPKAQFEIAAVVTQPTKRRKRKGPAEASAVGIMAERLGLPILTPEKANDCGFLDELERFQPDLCVTAAYGQYLPRRFLATPRLGTVNLHPSLLPKWRGAAPVQRSLEAGDAVVGVSVLYTVSRMDAGPIIAQETLALDGSETATTVLPTLFAMGTRLLLGVLPEILNGTITMETATQQDESLVVAADKIEASEAELRVWEESAITCHNRLRGFHMWPQTFLWLHLGRDDNVESTLQEPSPDDMIQVKVLQSRVVPGPPVPATNIVRLGSTKQSGLYVVCFDGSILELLVVQPATRRAFAARDLQNGYPGATLRWVRPPVPVNGPPTPTTDVSEQATLTTDA
jgi:methionyl-tRNA formyltransferase